MKVSKLGLKQKMLVAAVAMAATGAAHAIDQTNNAPYGSELVFSIWDPTVGQEASFTLGLNVDLNTFSSSVATAPGYSVNFGNIFSDAGFQQFLGAASLNGANDLNSLRWNIGAANTILSFNEVMGFTHGPAGPLNDVTNAEVIQASGGAANFFSNFGSGNSGGIDGTGPKYAGNPVNWGETMVGGIFQGTAGSVGDSLGFYVFTNNQESSGTFDEQALADGGAYQNQYGFGAFTLSANGQLTYSIADAPTNPPPVPVPAAVWLLGSAMVGLVGVARRRESEKA